LWVAILGGLYSSTATTIVLARRAATEPATAWQAQTGIILATTIMYVRLLVIVALFNLPLARHLAPAMLTLSVFGLALGGFWYWVSATPTRSRAAVRPPTNPLELTAALIFATLFVVISLASAWVQNQFGNGGLFTLAAIVGATDIDPFVLNTAASGVAPFSADVSGAAILIAASTNNLAKAVYAAAFAGGRLAAGPAGALAMLAFAGGIVAWWIALGG
jgi:uncharacterized membrane protein (DUF4010 family)